MNKEKLIEKMREDMTEISNRPYPFQTTADFLINEFAKACAEAALKELDNEWVRVGSGVFPEDGKEVLVMWCGIRCITEYRNGEFLDDYDSNKLHKGITHWCNIPSPPKDK